jgi:chromosome segregation ATPase
MEFENTHKRLQVQIEQLTEKNNELELKAKFDSTDLSKEIQNLTEQLEQTEQQKQKLVEQNRGLEQQKLKLLKESEDRFKARIKSLELQLEDQNNKSVREVRDVQAKSEENLSQLKNFYEIEKERLERRIAEEKDKYEKKLAIINEEYESKTREEQQIHEEELENLRDDLRETEMQSNSLTQQYEHELSLRQQTIDTLEKYVKDTKDSLNSIHHSNAASIEQHLANFSNERISLMNKIEVLNAELSKKDKELFALTQAKEHLEVGIVKKEVSMERIKKELTDEKHSLNEKLEELRSKFQKVSDEYLEKKVDYGRELALSQQQNEFLNKKIEELQKQIDEIIKRYEEKLKIQKQEYVQELNDKLERAAEEKNQIEAKYEKSRKALKEIEGTYNKQLSQLEKEKAIVQEKLYNLEAKKSEGEKKLMGDVQALNAQTNQYKDQFNQERKSLLSEIEKYKGQYIQLEQEYSEVVSNYERDKALWKGKFHFLEQQKEQAKNDLIDAQKKFELTLQHLQKHRNADKEESESSQNALMTSIEKRYQGQLQESTEHHQHVVQEYEEKIRKLEKELKSANDKMLIDSYGKMGSQTYIEKKIAEMTENEKRLQQDLENVKSDRDAKIMEYQRLLDQDRDVLKAKISEADQKTKESENKRGTLVFEHEKERAKWNLERDHLANQKNELQDLVSKLEKKKEALLRDNEKLKNESRVTRRSINLTGNQTQKLRPSSPGGSLQLKSTLSIDKGLMDITNYHSGGGLKGYESTKGSTLSRSGTTTSINSEEDIFMN